MAKKLEIGLVENLGNPVLDTVLTKSLQVLGIGILKKKNEILKKKKTEKVVMKIVLKFWGKFGYMYRKCLKIRFSKFRMLRSF